MRTRASFPSASATWLAVGGFDMADINVPFQGSNEPGAATGQVNQTIGVRVQHLSKGMRWVGVKVAANTWCVG